MTINLLLWCDEKITYLKDHGIQFESGVAVLPKSCIYEKIPVMVSTYKYRNDIPDELKEDSLLTYFMPESSLWSRLKKIDEEISELKKYGGVSGFDLSPSIGMLRPRQKLSILINSLYNCYLAVQGIKVLPNDRLGDLGTMSMSVSVPQNSNFISSRLGCIRYGFKAYGDYQLGLFLENHKPNILFVYGGMKSGEGKNLIDRYGFKIITYPDRRNRVRNGSKAYIIYRKDGKVRKIPLSNWLKGGAA